MKNVKGFTDKLTGGSGNIGEIFRQQMLWEGRAKTKRLAARVTAVEDNQARLADIIDTQLQKGNQKITRQEQQLQAIQNPLNLKNITFTQMIAGNSKQDILYAHKLNEKNTNLLSEFVKHTKKIEKNTQNIIDQNTKIK